MEGDAMTDQELLLAISEIVEKKIKAEVDPLRVDMKTMESGIRQDMKDMESGIRQDMAAMESGIRQDMKDMESGIRQDMKDMESGIRQDMVTMESGIRQDMAEMKTDIQALKDGQVKINLVLENEICPKIDLLAENYVPAAKRYEKTAAQIESMQADIDVLKSVVEEHSEKLKKIS